MKIRDLRATTVTVPLEAPLRHANGCHWGRFVRTIVEVEADKYMNELLRDLYGGKYDAIRAIVVRDVYELMEKIVDRCHDTGNVVMHIVLKNS